MYASRPRDTDSAGSGSSWSPIRQASPASSRPTIPWTRFIDGLPMNVATNRFVGRS
jgi:hypothetical protein